MGFQNQWVWVGARNLFLRNSPGGGSDRRHAVTALSGVLGFFRVRLCPLTPHTLCKPTQDGACWNPCPYTQIANPRGQIHVCISSMLPGRRLVLRNQASNKGINHLYIQTSCSRTCDQRPCKLSNAPPFLQAGPAPPYSFGGINDADTVLRHLVL